MTIQLNKPYKDVQNFKKLPLKRANDGSIIYLEDIKNRDRAESTRTLFKGNGKQVGIGIYQQSDANTIDVADGVKKD